VSEINEAVRLKFQKATARWDLSAQEKRDLVAWYDGDFEDIERIDQAQFNLCVSARIKHLRKQTEGN